MRLLRGAPVPVFLAVAMLPPVSPKPVPTPFGLPLSFEAGPDGSSFVARGPGYRVTLSPTEAGVFRGRESFAIRMAAARSSARLEGLNLLPGVANHFSGADPAAWRRKVPRYAKVLCREIYPGVDLVFYGRAGNLEYDFIVAPGTDPGRIRLEFDGARSVHVDEGGDLVLATAAGEVRQRRPVIYQEIDGRRRLMAGGYLLLGRESAGFRIGAYDRTRPLVIDPVLSYATFLGGKNMDIATDAAVDGAGNVYVVGGTASTDFPTTSGALRPVYGGGIDVMPAEGIGIGDGYVTKLSPDGTTILYSTYLGGDDGDFVAAVTADSIGNAYITGFTRSRNFPVTEGALQPYYNGGRNWSDDFPIHFGDAFVAKLDPSGALVYSTYLGGSASDTGLGIAVDGTGNAYVVGSTNSTDFPVSDGAVQRIHAGGTTVAPDLPIDFGDAFVAKINDRGTAILYATFLGGSKSDLLTGIAVDGSGAIYVAGTTWSKDFPVTPGAYRAAGGDSDVVVAKLNETGSALLYSSSFGGSGADECYGLAIDAGGNVYVAGRTRGMGFPVTSAAFQSRSGGNDDVFLTKLNAAGTELVYSTFLGGKGAENCFRPAVDTAGNAYIAGDSRSPDFPTTPDAILRRLSGQHNAFVAKFDPSGSALVYSTLIGGGDDSKSTRVALDPAGGIYVIGFTSSLDFPASTGASQPKHAGMYDGFVLKIAELGVPAALPALSPGAEQRARATKGIKLLRWLKSQVERN